MSLPTPAQRMTKPMLLIAAVVASLAFAVWGVERGSSALIGVTLSLANWFALRWLVARLVDKESGPNRAALGLLLMAKIGFLIAIVFVLLNKLHLDPIGLAFGLGVLFLGPALAGLLANLSGPSLNPSAAGAAREER